MICPLMRTFDLFTPELAGLSMMTLRKMTSQSHAFLNSGFASELNTGNALDLTLENRQTNLTTKQGKCGGNGFEKSKKGYYSILFIEFDKFDVM